ncbi:MAG TPA: ThiF family adenylyltransferase [Casimicrobiaceae bacterium]|nr:ThiF family adenylyltransferase [Casimicrobiaceae bacterium]
MSHALKITGATRLYAIIGDPIAQVRSPESFSERFAATGIDAILVPAHVPARSFDTIVPALLELGNLDGVLVTIPFKARMVAFAQRLGVTAKTVGAVNALRREADGSWTGDMFDGIGFVRGAELKGERIRDRRVALFGAGGAGSAIACALADARVKSIDIIDTDATKASVLVDKLKRAFPECASTASNLVPHNVDMIVNASPVGMRPDDGLPADVGPLDPSTLVGDVVITPTPTAIIRHAMRFGCHWVDGRDMHGGQIDAITAFFASASGAADVDCVSPSS